MPGPNLRHLCHLCHLAGLLLCVACFQDGPATETGSSGGTSTSTSTDTSTSTATSDASTGVPTTSGQASDTGSSGHGSSDTGSDSTGSTTEPVCMTPWYRDFDDDGHGDPNVVQFACMRPAGHVALGDDCDDMDAARAPGAPSNVTTRITTVIP